MQFDSRGELLIASTREGVVSLWDFITLREAGHCRTGPDAAKPVLVIYSNVRASSIVWDPVHDTRVALASHNSTDVHIYDLERCKNDPTTLLKTGYAGSASIVQYSNTGRFTLAATGVASHGHVCIFDTRKGRTPCASIRYTTEARRVESLAIVDDDTVLAAGTDGNKVGGGWLLGVVLVM